MDKISGIIPASARVTTVDMKNSGVARPGTPSFGREVGVSHLAMNRGEPNTMGRATEEFDNQLSLRQPSKDPKAKIVSDIADKFFISKAREYDAPEIKPEGMYEPEVNMAQQQFSQVRNDVPVKTHLHAEAVPQETGDEAAVGHYLDVHA